METYLITVDADAKVRFIYTDKLRGLLDEGVAEVKRASHVEPDGANWFCDLSPVGGPMVRGFRLRQDALDYEAAWLNEHWLCCPHNEMIANDEPGRAWKCAQCGYVYG